MYYTSMESSRLAVIEKLNEINLSEDWYHSFMNLLIELDKTNPQEVEDFLGQAADKYKEVLSSSNIEDTFKTLAKDGACIPEVLGCFVLTDPQGTAIPVGGAEPMQPAEFAPKTEKIIKALLANKIFADDMTIYRGRVLDGMMREAPYTLIDIPRIKRQIAVCDQIGQITFFSRNRLSVYDWTSLSKDQLRGTDGVFDYRYSREEDWALGLVEKILTNEQGTKIIPSETEKVKMPRRSNKSLLTEQQIVEWIKIFYEKENKYPSSGDKYVYERDGKGGYKIVEDEAWKSIEGSVTKKGRYTGSITTFTELKKKHGFVIDRNLYVEQIKEWMQIFYEVKGKYPSTEDDEVYERDGKDIYRVIQDRKWKSISWALMNKKMGLENIPDDESSLEKFREKYGFVGKADDLTEAKIKEWIEIFYEKESKYPHAEDPNVYERDSNGGYRIIKREKWQNINANLIRGGRGLSGGSSLADFKEGHGFTDKIVRTVEQLKEWMEIYYEYKGKYPSNIGKKSVYKRSDKGGFDVAEGDDWSNIDRALERGEIVGLTEKMTLADFKVKFGYKSADLTVDQVKEWIEIFYEYKGKYPSQHDKEVFERDENGGYRVVEEEVWQEIGTALYNGSRGLPEIPFGEFKKKYGYENKYSEEKIKDWVEIFYEVKGKYPSQEDKHVYERDEEGGYRVVEGESWNAINSALYKGFRGLEGGSSLAKFKQERGFIDKPTTKTHPRINSSGEGREIER